MSILIKFKHDLHYYNILFILLYTQTFWVAFRVTKFPYFFLNILMYRFAVHFCWSVHLKNPWPFYTLQLEFGYLSKTNIFIWNAWFNIILFYYFYYSYKDNGNKYNCILCSYLLQSRLYRYTMTLDYRH